MTNTKTMKRFGVVVFSVGFVLMMASNQVYHLLGGILILLSVWMDLFTQEAIDAHYEKLDNHPPSHSPVDNMGTTSTTNI